MQKRKLTYKRNIVLSSLIVLMLLPTLAMSEISNKQSYQYSKYSQSIKSRNGKFYAYIVLLFNENPHFVNIIQKGTIRLKEISVEGFNIKAYRNYLSSIRNSKLHKDAQLILKIFLEPQSFDSKSLISIEQKLIKRNVIVKFFKESKVTNTNVTLDYCIYGEKNKIHITHPVLKFDDDVFVVKPYIYYDEFSTSNSTFYHDMIYIDSEEVKNDVLIAKSIIRGKENKYLFFVGSRITDDIRFCLTKAFSGTGNISSDMWKMFVVHELTHKIMNNRYNSFDQVTGEEISMSSSIYYNTFLGLSVMYSYLNYSKFNPHRIAALNYIQYISKELKDDKYINDPGLVKYIKPDILKRITRGHINSCLEGIVKDK